MLIFENNIPDYLLSSPFLQGMLSEGPFPEAGIEIPDGCLKQNMAVITHTLIFDGFVSHTAFFGFSLNSWRIVRTFSSLLGVL